MSRIYQSYYREYLRISRARAEDVSKWELPVAAARLREWIPQEESQRLLELIHSLIA